MLAIALGLNFSMFAVGLVAGLYFVSTGLLADSLDMLTDALVYALSLLAILRGEGFRRASTRVSGSILLLLGLGIMAEAIRRVFHGGQPEGLGMIGIATVSLAVNSLVLWLLVRYRDGEVNVRASYICTRADVVANFGVILSGLLVIATGSRYPDLIIGLCIGIYVMKEALEILGLAREPIAA